MTGIAGLLDHPWSQALAWTLINFIWQGALLGLGAVAVLRLLKLPPNARYLVAVSTLALMLSAPFVTFAVLVGDASPSPAAWRADAGESVALPPAVVPAEPALAAGAAGPVPDMPGRTARIEVIVLAVWLLGVTLLSVRLVGGWVVARRLTRRSVRPVNRELESLARRIAGRLALDRVVRVAESTVVSVPVLVGWLKPVILLPASALSGLTATQIEALLAHELAHVRRHDYVVNLLQSVVETVLFYHPAVWWVSGEVRREREHCCDDVAVGVCDRVEYVTALANLAAMTSVPRTALAATGGSLVGRVRRLLVPSSDDRRSSAVGWMAVSAVVLGVALAGASVSSAVASPEPADQAAPTMAVTPMEVSGPTAAPPQGIVATPVASPQTPPPPPPPARVRPVPPAPPAPDAPPADQSARQADEQARVDMERAMREIQRQMMEAQKEIDMKRLELELQRVQLETQLQLEMAKTQIEGLSRQMEQAQKRVAAGLASPEVQAEIERQLAEAKQHLRMAEAELQMRRADIDLRRREAETRVDYERRILDLEMAQVEAVAPRPGRELYVVMPEMTEPLGANEPARSGDVLQIQIAGEPQLPRNYEVSGDGSIRMPFMGSIRVQGLTASEIREELTRQLAARGLKTNASVSVTVRRR